MELIPSETTLVVAGAWNVAILNPAWVQKYGLEKSDGLVQVAIPAAMGGIVDFPRYTIGEIQYLIRPDWLQISSATSSKLAFEKMESFASKILAQLPHTPVSGVGHNFTFIDRTPPTALLSRFTNANQDITDKLGRDFQIASASVAVTIANQEKSVFTNITRTFEAEIVMVKVNVHHPATSIKQVDMLSGTGGYRRMDDNLAIVELLLGS